MSDEPRNFLDDPKIRIDPLEGDVEMTLAQWVDTLPPGHGARRELLALREKSEELIAVRGDKDRYAAQIARLPAPSSIMAAEVRVDSVLKRVLDAESALAELVALIEEGGDPRLTVHQSYQAAVQLLFRRPRGMGGTAHGVSR